MSTASQDQTPLDELGVADRAHFQQGPPLELFRRLRAECPVHWSSGIAEFPDEDGFWSVTTAEDVFEVSRDWQTYSSEVGGFTASNAGLSLEMQQAMLIGMDPPKHDRLKALFQRGFTPKRIAEHEDAIRAITIEVPNRASAVVGKGGRAKCRATALRICDERWNSISVDGFPALLVVIPTAHMPPPPGIALTAASPFSSALGLGLSTSDQ